MADAGDRPGGRRGTRRRRLGIALVIVSFLLLVAVGVVAWLYFSFSANVSAANGKIDPDIQHALETPPPTTLVTIPQTSTPSTDTAANPDDPGTVMNILILGSDARPGAVEGPGSSDVIMLLHVDTRLDYLSMLSITRDLYLDIPGYGMDRINSAYYRGGPALTIETLKNSLGIDVTKYLGLGFEAFPSMIDALGGVYVDVDRRYTDTPWWDFDLSPGYQLLDGANALLYSRYRFDENADFGRMARQQRILAALRDQARGWQNKLKLPGMVNTILETAATNLSAQEMLDMARWLIKLDGTRMKQIIIKGPGKMIDGKAVVVVDKAALTQAVTDFLTAPPEQPGQAESGDETLLAAAGDDSLRSVLASPVDAVVGTGATSTGSAILDAPAWRAAQKTVSFPLEAPMFLPEGFVYAGKMPEGDGTYGIEVGNGTKPAVRVLYRFQQTDAYLGVSATTWLDAPLAGEGTVVESGGITYTVVGTLGKPDHVWWKRDGVLYWVSNTLMYALGEQDLLKIAEAMQPVSAG